MMFQALCSFSQLKRRVQERLNIPELRTVGETAEALRISVSKVYALIAEGELKAYSLGTAKRVSIAAILDFLKRSEM